MNKKKIIPILIGVAVVVVCVAGYIIFTQDQAGDMKEAVNAGKPVEITEEQYKAILQGVFAADKDGKIIIKSDYIMTKVMELETRIKALEDKEIVAPVIK